ncbi:MAG: NUDIX hydrolase [Acidobacteriota bacterium]|nr:NUDIX hydrolase [Acidobacteriota bacterium]
MKVICRIFLVGWVMTTAAAGELPEGYWNTDQMQPILDKTLRLRLAPDLSGLSAAEKETVGLLLEAGKLLHELYEHSLHHQALSARDSLLDLHKAGADRNRTQALMDLYRMFRGPTATTPDNQRLAFLPVTPELPARNVYPADVTRDSMDAYLAAHPNQGTAFSHPRALIRKATAENRAADLEALRRRPESAVYHPGLADRIRNAPEGGMYAFPYSLAYGDRLYKVYNLLCRASDLMKAEDPDFSDYLRLRARDLLTDDYEAGDASWITGRFKNLNAQIGSYETYDDKILGVKSFFSLSLLLRDRQRSEEMSQAIKGLQKLHDSLPYTTERKIREDIPVGVYQVIADFGQARGTNTASILPNESHITRKYGRIILLRHNIMTNPEIYKLVSASWKAAVAGKHADDLTLDAGFQRTLWHEIGHYLGVDRDKQDRTLDVALGRHSNMLEELKADLVSMYSVKQLTEQGYHDKKGRRAVYASGIYRTLQKVKPRRTQPYQTMQLMQMNYYLDRGMLRFNRSGKKLLINYDKYHETVAAMLKEVLALQHGGDPDAVDAFVDKYFRWTDRHEQLGAAMRGASTYRYRLVTYAAMGE